MNDELTPLLAASIAFAYVGGLTFVALGVVLSIRRRRLHPHPKARRNPRGRPRPSG